MVPLASREPKARVSYGTLLGSTLGQGPQVVAWRSVTLYSPVGFRLGSWMRKGDSHLELLIYLAEEPHSAETKTRQGALHGPSEGPRAHGTAPVMTLTTVPPCAVLWCLTHGLPAYHWVCDLSMCVSLTGAGTTLGLGHCWNVPVFSLLSAPLQLGAGGLEERAGIGMGSMATKEQHGNWEAFQAIFFNKKLLEDCDCI